MTQPPKPTTGEEIVLDLTGKLMPWEPKIQQPVLFKLPGSDAYYLALFTAREDLDTAMTKVVKHTTYTIKKIDNGREFLDSIPLIYQTQRLHIIVDFRIVEGERCRFTQVQRPEPSPGELSS